jgi:hypothetical protein
MLVGGLREYYPTAVPVHKREVDRCAAEISCSTWRCG